MVSRQSDVNDMTAVIRGAIADLARAQLERSALFGQSDKSGSDTAVINHPPLQSLQHCFLQGLVVWLGSPAAAPLGLAQGSMMPGTPDSC